MSNPSWPGTLPGYVLEQGFGESLAEQVLESPMEVGPAKRRRRYTRNNRVFTASMMMTDSQSASFESFYYTTLIGGTLPFDWVHPRLQTAMTFVFRRPAPKITELKGEIRTWSFALEAYSDPTYATSGITTAAGRGSAVATSLVVAASTGTAAGAGYLNAAGASAPTGTAAGAGSASATSVAIVAASGTAAGTGAAAAAGTTVVPVQLVHVGTTTDGNGSTRAGFTNGLCAMSPVTTASSLTVFAVCMRQMSTSPAGTHLKPVIYSDASGQPGNLLFVGAQYTVASAAANKDISLPFAAPITLPAGNYWVGAIADGTFNADGPGSAAGTHTLYWYTGTYASPLATASGMSNNTNLMTAYLAAAGSTTAGATVGFVASTESHGGGSYIRGSWPTDLAIGDIAFLHVNFLNTSGGPTWAAPEGWTLINESGYVGVFGNSRELLYWKRVDGTEVMPNIGQTTAGVSVVQFNVSVWRGYQAAGTPYEAFALNGASASATPAGTAITTLGANRTVLNFFADFTNATNTHNAGPSFVDKYNIAGSGSGSCLSVLSAFDQATAGAVAAETRTLSSSQNWRCMTIAVIKA